MKFKQIVTAASLAVRSFGLCAGILQAGTLGAQTPKPDQLFEKISPSIWFVTTFDGAERPLAQGSAVVIGIGSLITNCHVLVKAKSFVIKQDNVFYGASLAYSDLERDLCQIQVKNFSAPAVELAPTNQLKVGQKVYAIGNPRGLELTFSDGMISGLRKSDDEKTVMRVQTTAPISHGSSGGGLFDERGRLVGITSSGFKDSQNLNFAIPADWIKEIPARAKEAAEKRTTIEAGSGIPAGKSNTKRGQYFIGQVWTYTVIDRMTQSRQNFDLQVDRFDENAVIFNRGRRVENLNGRITGADGRVLSELDSLNAIGGWVRADSTSMRKWKIDSVDRDNHRLELQGEYTGDSKVTTPAGEFDVQAFHFTGFRRSTQLVGSNLGVATPYEATAWFAPAIGRIVKFSAVSPASQNGRATVIKLLAIDEEVSLERFDQ